MRYDVDPFLPRVLDIAALMLVAEGDDLTLWDLEIEAFNAPAHGRRSGWRSCARRRT